ncbi:hypothetical protein LguiA_033752 [Lonicera macranthoides]
MFVLIERLVHRIGLPVGQIEKLRKYINALTLMSCNIIINNNNNKRSSRGILVRLCKPPQNAWLNAIKEHASVGNFVEVSKNFNPAFLPD